MSESANSLNSLDRNKIREEGANRKKKALDWLLASYGSGTGEIPDPGKPEDIDRLLSGSRFCSSMANQEARYQKRQSANVFFSLAEDIGPRPRENQQIVETVSTLKQKIKNQPEMLEITREQANLGLLANSQKTHMDFLDAVQGTHSVAEARIYYPERFKYLTEDLMETTDLSVDEIYSLYLSYLQKCIDDGRSEGYPEDERGADSLGNYVKIYKKLTEG